MAFHRTAGALRHLGDATRAAGLADAPDADLLARFARARDEAAFAELVRRHGPLVLGVCRRVAGHREDAEDAFQAAFLILATKAGRLSRPHLLANYLYGVAVRVARRARRTAARRRRREGQVTPFPNPPAAPPADAGDWSPFLEDALASLPVRYRTAIVLCDLRQTPRAEAAKALGIPEGTLSSRLATGRKKLADRLARRGVSLPAAALGAVLTEHGASAVPADLAAKAVAVAATWAAGGTVAIPIQSLVFDGGRVMWKVMGVAAVLLATVGLTVGVVGGPAGVVADPPKPAVAEPPAADAGPGENKAIPKRKPRLVQTADFDGAFNAAAWSPDGAALVTSDPAGQFMIDARTLALIPTSPANNDAQRAVVGFTRVDPSVVMYSRDAGRINTYTRLQFLTLPTDERRLWGSPQRSVTADPEDGRPVAVTPDGKTVLTLSESTRVRRVELEQPGFQVATVRVHRFRIVDAVGWNWTRDLGVVEGQDINFAVSADATRLVTVARTVAPVGLRVECLDSATGRRVWSRDFMPLPAAPNTPFDGVGVSADGKRVVVCVKSVRAEEGVPPQSTKPAKGGRGNPFAGNGNAITVGKVLQLDGDTGADAGPPLAADDAYWHYLQYSHDGRLVVGTSDNAIRVWDTRTGAAVKTWPGTAVTVFAPDRLTLAILERYEVGGHTDPKTGAQVDGRSRTSIGLWDLSPLLK